MREEEAAAVVTVPQAGRDGEQPGPPSALGACGELGGGSPQESRKQCEFPSSRRHGGRTWARGSRERRTGETAVGLAEATKVLEGGVGVAVLAKVRAKGIWSISPSPPS